MTRKSPPTKDRSLVIYGLAITAIGLAATRTLAVRKKSSTRQTSADQRTGQPTHITTSPPTTQGHGNARFASVASRLVWFWVAIVAMTVITRFRWLAMVTVVFTEAMPFILPILWLGLSDIGRRLRAWLSIWHLRMFLSALFFCYVTWGHQWANDTINNLFHVDAKYFGITSTALTAISIPFGILYRPEVVRVMYLTYMLLLLLATPVCGIYLLLTPDVTMRGKKIIFLLAVVTMGFVGFPLTLGVSTNFKTVVTSFALWADFNESHLCTDAWAPEAKGVVFLDNGKVLAYFPSSGGTHFKVMSCNEAKTL